VAQKKRLARGFTIEVESSTPNTWLAIGGINTFDMPRSKNNADVTDFDSAGAEEHIVASRNQGLTWGGFYMEDDTTPFGRDPGQERLEVLSVALGDASIGTMRVTTPSGRTKELNGSVDVSGPTGGNNDPAGFSGTLDGSGAVANWSAPA
jgi:predicted secreted protein